MSARRIPLWLEIPVLLVVALGLAILIKTFLVQSFYIPSASMEPGLVKNDRILVEKPSYWFGGTPQRGDVVVFGDPGDWLSAEEAAGPSGPLQTALSKVGLYPTGGHLVKRVIGVAGDVIECCDDQGRISVNGEPLDEDGYISPQARCNGPMTQNCDWTAGPVPDGELFVMGDNRDRSGDSSYHLCPPGADGCDPDDAYVPTDLVVGKVLALVWPSDRMKILRRPATFDDVPDAQ